MLDRRTLAQFLIENSRRTGNPLGVPSEKLSEWAHGLDIDIHMNSRTVLYTGLLYQLVPYIKGLESLMSRFEESRVYSLASSMGSRLQSRIAGFSADRKLKDRVTKILMNAYKLLDASGYEPAYYGRLEPYSGALFYDLGMLEAFKEHANKVLEFLEENGVELVITLDPHTTIALKVLYPRFVGKTPEVRHLLELAIDDVVSGRGGRVVVHDPCLLARSLHLHGRLRRILRAAGYEILEPRRSRERTFCCGGPLESLFPKLSSEIACRRLSQLSKLSETAVAACPICLANLTRDCGPKVSVLDWLELVEVKA